MLRISFSFCCWPASSRTFSSESSSGICTWTWATMPRVCWETTCICTAPRCSWSTPVKWLWSWHVSSCNRRDNRLTSPCPHLTTTQMHLSKWFSSAIEWTWPLPVSSHWFPWIAKLLCKILSPDLAKKKLQLFLRNFGNFALSLAAAFYDILSRYLFIAECGLANNILAFAQKFRGS